MKYQKPKIETLCELKTERVFAAQSWNNGKGNQDHKGNGNSGINYKQSKESK